MLSLFPKLNAANYEPHLLHSAERNWPETNCYVDLWIEVLSAIGTNPIAMLGFTLTQDFEGDQFTFFKVPLEDLESLYGIRVTELAIYDSAESHVEVQLKRGRLCLVEVDGFYLPDTKGVGYGNEHGKTTIAINSIDSDTCHLGYFHNGGYYTLEGADYDGIFQRNSSAGSLPFLPYTEFAKLPSSLPSEAQLKKQATDLLMHHFKRIPHANPLSAFAAVFEAHSIELTEKPFDAFHKYAFNTLRQFGANFELLATHLNWLSNEAHFKKAADASLRIAETAKICQFQLARAVTRKKTDGLSARLIPAIEAWDELMLNLKAELLS